MPEYYGPDIITTLAKRLRPYLLGVGESLTQANEWDKIILIVADGGGTSYYPATGAGLTSALSAASSGDVIYIPSGTFSGSQTIPSGVNVFGFGETSILSGTITNNGYIRNFNITGNLVNTGYCELIHVVCSSGYGIQQATETAILSACSVNGQTGCTHMFYITNGRVWRSWSGVDGVGVGLYANGSKVIVDTCRFFGQIGGQIETCDVITSSTFRSATGYDALYHTTGSGIINNCSFHANDSGDYDVNLAAAGLEFQDVSFQTITGESYITGIADIGVLPSVCDGRLTLTTGTPITTSDVTAATTIYFTNFNGNHIGVYDGTKWLVKQFSELSLSLSGYTANSNYDVFVYDNSGVLTLETTIWSDSYTRATALTTQDGIYVKSGAATRRYLGTIRITGTTGQCEDSKTNRFVWNYYNRTQRLLVVTDSTDSWTYNTASWRSANNSTANRVNLVVGLAGDIVAATVLCRITINSGQNGSVGIGVNSTATNYAQLMADVSVGAATWATQVTTQAAYAGFLGIGLTYLQWLEYARTGTVTFYGDSGIPTSSQSGLMGFCRA